jgi:outer membrane protein OmpA-like peptidoglycan-associated protein
VSQTLRAEGFLSERRAWAIRDYLVQNGVTDDGRIQTVGRGPVAADRP